MWNKIEAFRTARQRERRRLGRFFGAAAVFLALFLVVSAVIIGIHSGGFSSGADKTDTSGSAVSQSIETVTGVKNLLLLCASESKTEIRFLAVVQINFDENSYSVCAFSPRQTVDTGDRFASFLEHYQSGGVKQLIRAVEQISGIRIDRYIASDDNSFKRAINSMGAAVFNFPEQINYRGADFAIILVQGEQKLRGDELLKYLRYCGAIGDEGLEMQAAALGSLFVQYINENTFEKRDNYYSSLINTLQSDISVMDFKKAKPMLEYLQATPFEVQSIRYFRIIANEEAQP